MKLGNAKLEIVAALEGLRQTPERGHPFVVVEAKGGGAFVQFAGSAVRPLVFDVPLVNDRAIDLRGEPGWTRTRWGIAIEGVTPERGAELAVDVLHRFGLDEDQEVTITQGIDRGASVRGRA